MSITVVASAKGGVGKSTFCVGVGKMLAELGEKVLLVDMDIGVRSLDLLLGVAEKTVYDWGDVLRGNCDRQKCVLKCGEKLSLIPAPQDLFGDFDPEKLKGFIDGFQNEYPYILLDAPAGLETGFRLASHCAENCVIVSTADPVSIRAAASAAVNVRKMGVNDLRLVVDRYDKKCGVCIDGLIDTVGARLLGVIPESEEVAHSALGAHVPFDCKGNQAFLRIARRMTGENIPIREKYL